MAIFSLLRRRILGIMILSVVLLLPTLLSAEEFKNIGFKKDVPKELKQKFPICDEFLDVKWIGKNKDKSSVTPEEVNIGKLKAEYYENDKNTGITYFLLLDTDFHISSEYKSKEFEKFINSKEFEKFILRADLSYIKGFWLVARQGKKKKEFTKVTFPFHPKGDKESSMKSFAGFTKNICLLSPDAETVRIIETKKPFQNENLTGESKEKFDRILKIATERCDKSIEIAKTNRDYRCKGMTPDECDDITKAAKGYKCDMHPLKYGNSIDVDFDGIEEYISGYSIYIDLEEGKTRWKYKDNRKYIQGKGFILFFQKGRLKFLGIDSEKCTGRGNGLYFIAERRVLFDGKCNLTELIKGGN